MNGRLVVEHRGDNICLRLRYYPLWIALGTYGFMSCLAAFMLQRSADADFNQMVVFLAALLPTVFVAIAVYLEKQPPLLQYHVASQELLIPREQRHLHAPTHRAIGVGDVHFRVGTTRIHGQALYITPDTPANRRPVFVDHFPKRLAARAEEFAQRTDLKIFRAPTLTL